MLPVSPVVKPSSLAGQQNGKVAADRLRSVTTPGGTATLVTPAHRSWLALEDAARKAGHVLVPFSTYRSYASQEKLFTARYTTKQISTTDRKVWNHTRYYKLPGVPVTAAPGTSNHGWGLAIDCRARRNGQNVSIDSQTDATFRWLLANAERFGFSWEIQSERWHIRYFAGDAIPAATLAYAAGSTPAPQEDDMPTADEVADALIAKGVLTKDYYVDRSGQLHNEVRNWSGRNYNAILGVKAGADSVDALADAIVEALTPELAAAVAARLKVVPT